MTTRRYPRTLDEAFADAHRARWHEGWQRTRHPWLDRLLAVAIGVALTLTIIYGG